MSRGATPPQTLCHTRTTHQKRTNAQSTLRPTATTARNVAFARHYHPHVAHCNVSNTPPLMAARFRPSSHSRFLKAYIHCLSMAAFTSGTFAAINIFGLLVSVSATIIARRALMVRRRNERLVMLRLAYHTCMIGVIIYGLAIIVLSVLALNDNCTQFIALQLQWVSAWYIPPLVLTQFIAAIVLAMLAMVLDLSFEDQLCDTEVLGGTELRGQEGTTETPMGRPAWYTPRGSPASNPRDTVMGIPVTV
jgi:hypothetical protein